MFVYVFGLLGLLRTGLFIITGLGVVLGIYTLITSPGTFIHWKTLVFLLACGLLWLRYHNALLLQYDDFSHWGLIAQQLLYNDVLPDKNAVLIQFKSYPPASACWIYAVCFFAGSSDGMMITAQAWFTLVALLPLFGVSGKKTGAYSFGIIVLIVIVLSIYQGTASLMVDNLLAAVAIGVAAMAVQMRQSIRIWSLAVVLMTLCLIKDSGLYFALLVIALCYFLLRRGHLPKKRLFPLILLPAAGRAIWWIHIKTAFSDAVLTRHAFTLENMEAVSAGRTWENFIAIGKAVLRSALTRYNHSLLMLGLMLICCTAIVLLRYFHTRKLSFSREAALLIGSCVIYGFYLALLFGMYYFTMPLEAALEAVAFERYNITLALFLYGLFTMYILLMPLDLLPFKRMMPFVLAMMIAVPIAIPIYRSGVHRLISETYSVPVREQIYALEEKRPLQSVETAGLYIGDLSLQGDFVSYIAAYTFQQNLTIYTTDTLDTAALPDVLYALVTDDVLDILVDQEKVEIVTL